MKENNKNPYPEIINDLLPRFFSQGDWNPYSTTYGCFDRNYWHYRTTTDLPSAVFQQAVLSLALIFTIDDLENKFHLDQEVLQQAECAIGFWAKIQHRDGSFDEWYPFEQSHVATAFTSYAVSESLLLLDGHISEKIKDTALGSLKKAAYWLSKHYDRNVANHNAGALSALSNIYLLTKEKHWLEVAEKYILILKKQQSSEGWFCEYGGADPGYTGLTLDFLAKCHQRTGNKNLLPLIESALRFNAHFMHPDGSFGGVYGSRNTEYLLPHGFEILANKNGEARYLLRPFNDSALFQNLKGLRNADDRYLIFFFLPNYLQAWKDFNGQYIGNELFPENYYKFYSDAGLFVNMTKDQYLVSNLKKSGVVRVFQKETREEVYSDSGYVLEDETGRIFSSQWLDREKEINLSDTNSKITIYNDFVLVRSGPKKNYFIFFQIFMRTFGRIPFISSLLGFKIKIKYIVKFKRSKLYDFVRKLEQNDGGFEISDEIKWKKPPVRLSLLRNTSLLHVPTSKMIGLPKSENISLNFNDLRNTTGISVKIKRRRGEKQAQIILERIMSNECISIDTTVKSK